ncbi:hypothetical protein GCM10010387_22340 [Streptomyces inusitatus]|uniref:Uncharacterized protein n=1 Tax=Streptomyces inusitatus TaxID=68221 RepID=A0A918UQL0_9ACTN|nr:hypothetical protein [Streptomyces inusitatus]GGZ28416.1 hypothetical protein GCM10010387_22340 [Streptomyces inusitatus]
MIIAYTPEGGKPEHYDARSLRVSEASIVSRTIDQTWGDIKGNLQNDDLDAMRAIIWVIKKRAEPTLRFGDFDPGVDEMTTLFDKREIEDIVGGAFAVRNVDPEITAEQIVASLAAMPAAAADPEHARALIESLAADEGKAPAAGPEPGPPSEEPSPAPVTDSSSTSTPTGSSGSASSPTSSTSTPTVSTP